MRIALLVFAFCLSASGADVLSFTPFPQQGVTNFSVYYGPTNRLSTNRVHIGTATNWTVTGLPAGAVSFLYATAWTNGIESLPSNEILYTNRNFQPTIEIRLNMKIAPSLDGPRESYTNVLIARVPSTGNQKFFFMDALATLSQ